MSSVDLPAHPTSASLARHFAREQVAGYSEDVGNVVALLATELVANAVLHARTALLLAIETGPSSVRLTVTDGSTELPVRRNYDTDDVTGRGLALVDVLASRWGVEMTDGGKSVWCEITVAAGRESEQRV